MILQPTKTAIDMSYALSYDIGMAKTKIISPSQARADLYNIINQASAGTTEFLIQSKTGKTAVILSQDELDSWRETAEVLMTPGAQESIAAAKQDISKGNVVPLSEL